MASTTSDLTLLGRKLGALDYDPHLYVKEIARRCVGGHELHQQRVNIQTLSESTHSQLKKNVYQNYRQFIETAKEISFLETEMYQLSHMITEQRNLLTELTGANITGHKGEELSTDSSDQAKDEVEEPKESKHGAFEEGRKKLYELLEKVEGCSHVTDVPNRCLMHDGDLVEMDVTENTALRRVHGYLLNDGFMVATWLPNRRGPVRFKYSCLYELDSLAVVNVRDLGGIKHTFKLLVFPEARLFQCANADAKKVWMVAFENAKQNRQKEHETAALQRTDTLGHRERNPFKKMLTIGDSTESSNPFGDDNSDDNSNSSHKVIKAKSTRGGAQQHQDHVDVVIPEWLAELPDDLEVFIAQREFEQAVALVVRATDFCAANCDSAVVREASTRLEAKAQHLIDVLAGELSTDKSVQGGPRAARKAVQLLCRLGRSTQATDLFLQHRAAILQSSLKGGKMDSATVGYVQRQAVAFFNGLLDTSIEFRKAFSGEEAPATKMSSLLVWIHDHMDNFYERIEKQIFSPATPLETIAVCVELIRKQCAKLSDSGLDVSFLLDSQFRRHVDRTICEHRDKHVDAVKLRAQEDKWEPINCFNKAGTERFLEEMATAGIPSVRAHVQDQCWIALTRNTTSFSLSYLNLADSLLRLFNPSMRALVNESLVTVFHAHLRHIEQALRSDRLKKVDPKFIQRNAAFLLDTLLSLVEHKYQAKTGTDCPKLGKLHSSYSWLKDGSKINAPAVTTKYTDPNYV